jgi:pyrroloquinoline quinone biosynthesis protein E
VQPADLTGDFALSENSPRPLWLLAELTYACPLQCPYCSNPVDFARTKGELTTEQWIDTLREGRQIGAVQLGFSGGEPLVRRDLEDLVSEARTLGYYTNLITSAIGMDADRVRRLRDAGLDHIQISFQASDAALNNHFAGTDAFAHKVAMARAVKEQGYPMVLNVVLHRHNIDRTEAILDMALDLGADYVELANTQYYGWAFHNRHQLLPTREQLERSEAVANRYKEAHGDRMRILYVIPDYYADRPKPCMNGWGQVFLSVAPDGTALPCQGARMLPGLEFPKVTEHPLAWIWNESPAFNRFRGEGWMKEPCRSCPERDKDFGGCRCQAWLVTGDPASTDPVCDLSPDRGLIDRVVEAANDGAAGPGASDGEIPAMLFRNARNSRTLYS